MNLELPKTGAKVYVTVPSYERPDLVVKMLPEMVEKACHPFRLLLNLDWRVPMCGISFARNMLISKALEDSECKYVVALSNDVFDFTPAWLKTFVHFMSDPFSRPYIGAINGYNFANYQPDTWTTWTSKGKAVSYDSPDWEVEEVEGVGGQLTIMNAEALRAVGLYDLKYGLGSYEGLDLGRRMIKAGYKVLAVPNVRVKHDIINGNCKTLGETCKPWLESGPQA